MLEPHAGVEGAGIHFPALDEAEAVASEALDHPRGQLEAYVTVRVDEVALVEFGPLLGELDQRMLAIGLDHVYGAAAWLEYASDFGHQSVLFRRRNVAD